MRASEISLECHALKGTTPKHWPQYISVTKAEGTNRQNSLLWGIPSENKRHNLGITFQYRIIVIVFPFSFTRSITRHMLGHSQFPFQSWKQAIILQSTLFDSNQNKYFEVYVGLFTLGLLKSLFFTSKQCPTSEAKYIIQSSLKKYPLWRSFQYHSHKKYICMTILIMMSSLVGW